MSNDLDAVLASASAPVPLRHGETPELGWLYAAGEYEAALLDRLVADGRAASRYVEFAENYRRATSHLDLKLAAGTTGRLYTTDAVLPGPGTTVDAEPDGWWRVTSSGQPTVRIQAPVGAPAVAVALDEAGSWLATTDGLRWSAAAVRPGGRTPAHIAGEPVHSVAANLRDDDVWEFPRQVLGRIVLVGAGDAAPSIITGESLPELHTSMPELRFDLERQADGRWVSTHELCGRYLLVTAGQVTSVAVESRSRLHDRPGSFACSDARLTAIWQASALTLHLCSQGLVIDGLKRDRMPWAGDQALNTVSNSFAYGDGAIVRDGLVALGRPTHGYINGIADYSLWWVINASQYVRYFGDVGFAAEYADHLDRFLDDIARDADETGVLRPSERPDGFIGASAGSVFIDWGYALPADGPSGALQVLWHWALDAGATLLARAGHPSARRWSELASHVAEMLRARAWDASTRRWRTALDVVDAQPSAHPNLFAVLSGLDPDPEAPVLDAIRDGATGTPFMRGFALAALARGGRGAEAIAEIRERWGEMLDAGPGTMWEEFVGNDPYGMYGRPFAKSLCHAWASGPAALLPEIILGVRPTSDGWDTVHLEPALGPLDWAAATIPTPHGDLVVCAERTRVEVRIPAGVTVRLDGVDTAGPAHVEQDRR